MKKRLFCGLLIVMFAISPAVWAQNSKQEGGKLTGQVLLNTKPQAHALVAFFLVEKGLPPIPNGLQRVPDVIGHTDAEGRLAIKMTPGSYYLGILDRKPGEGKGPPQAGERYYFAVAPGGTLRQLTVKEDADTDAGPIESALPETFKETTGIFTVSGVVRSADSKVMPGVYVLAKQTLTEPRPEFVSKATDASGNFTIALPANQSFYLFARKSIGTSKPSPGDLMGVYGLTSANGLIPTNFSGASNAPAAAPPVEGTAAPQEAMGSEAKAVEGVNNASLEDITIYMYKIPDPDEMKAMNSKTDNIGQ